MRLVAGLLLSSLVTACSAPSGPSPDDASVALIEQYLQVQQEGDLAAAAAMYPDESLQQWQAFLQKSVRDRGQVQDYVIESVEMNTVYSGKYYLATVRVTGAEANSLEMITAFRQVTEDQTRIVSHKIKIRR